MQTNKEERVLNYYVLCNKLKDVIRTGWKTWNVKRDRLESVAEHVYGVQMLAIAMKSEYSYDIDSSTRYINFNDYNENINISKIQSNSIDLSSNPSSYEISKIIFDKVNDFRFRPDEYLGEDAFKKSNAQEFDLNCSYGVIRSIIY